MQKVHMEPEKFTELVNLLSRHETALEVAQEDLSDVSSEKKEVATAISHWEKVLYNVSQGRPSWTAQAVEDPSAVPFVAAVDEWVEAAKVTLANLHEEDRFLHGAYLTRLGLVSELEGKISALKLILENSAPYEPDEFSYESCEIFPYPAAG
jgi:hypothetical protein